jgi:ELWxxDGT repeat protein
LRRSRYGNWCCFWTPDIQTIAAGSSLIYEGPNASAGYGLWGIGAAGSSVQLGDVLLSSTDALKVGSSTFFSGTDQDFDRELWRTDGTASGTYRVVDLLAGDSSDAKPVATLNGEVLFVGDDGVVGTELWKSTGALGNRSLVKDIRAGATGTFPNNFFVNGTQVYFLLSSPKGMS